MVNENIMVTENTIKDFNNNMTLFYGKESGIIRDYAQGRQDLSYYGASAGDFNYDFIVISKDDYVLNNLEKFIIQDKKLMRKQETQLSKYEIANY